MQPVDVQNLVKQHMPDCQVVVENEGGHYLLKIISESFAGLSKLKRQQAVYACINSAIASGEIHAVTIKAFTPEEAKEI